MMQSALRWWQEAGVSTLVSDTQRPWFETDAPVPQLADTPASRDPAAGVPRLSPAGGFSNARTLDQFLADARAVNPHVPIADGNPASGVMVMGEGPSAEDLRTGRPFTGPAGQLLDRMLAAIELDRGNCYISLLAPRRLVPGPVPADAIAEDLELTCTHIRLAAPRAILLLGGPSAQALTGNRAPITRQRGEWAEIQIGDLHIPALPTFNPAYLLRRPEAKREAWTDLLSFRRRLWP